MKTSFQGKRNKRGDWMPEQPITPAPVMVWPPQPMAFLKWLPRYFWPWNLIYMTIPLVTWIWLTPRLELMKTFEPGWIAYLLARNLIMVLLFIGAWHWWLYVRRGQGTDFKYTTKWLARDNPVFLFRNQFLDNVFWTVVSAVPIWTAFEVVTLWLYANGIIPYVSWEEHPIYCTLLFILVPIMREVHFYWIHRLIHWGPIYKWVHYLHHNNVNVGPFSGLSMHPIEHVFYWTGVLIHWVVPSHPMHALFHMQHAAFTPTQSHAGFSAVALKEGLEMKTGDYFHYLHHKYFECNYGGDGPVVLDKVFGTFHDGTEEATTAMNTRFLARAAQKAKAENGT